VDHPDYRFLGEDKLGFGMFKPEAEIEAWQAQQKEEWLREKENRRIERKKQWQEQLLKQLSPKERDRAIRHILEQLLLSLEHKALLKKRGLTERQISEGEYCSVRQWQKLRKPADPGLPGVNRRGHLNNPYDGILIPVRDHNGYYVGLRLYDPYWQETGNPKYAWLSSSGRGLNPVLPNGEYPIAVYYPSVITQHNRVGLCEGLEWKPKLAAERLGCPVIGFAGTSFFPLSPETLKATLEKLGKTETIFIPDAGAIINRNVHKPATELMNMVMEWGYSIKIIWWGQTEKTAGDIDEISDETLARIEYLGAKEYISQGWREQNQRQIQQAQTRLHSLTYPVDLQLNCSRLPDLAPHIPNSGIVAIKSAKGTGKSWQIKQLRQLWEKTGKQVISITPRIALGRAQAIEWEINWIDDMGRLSNEVSVGLCWDSLQKIAHLNWKDKILIIDESELGIEHLLSSSTCKDKRAKILKIFQMVVKECLDSEGTLILSDADLTDVSVDYIKALAPDAPVFTIVNKALPKQWDVAFQTGKIDQTLEQLFMEIAEGKKVAVTTDCQAEAEALERAIALRFSDKEIHRVDGKTCQQDYGKTWVKKPNESIQLNRPDVLIYTSSMGVGVSITINYFDIVYGLFHGVVAPKDCRQMLARVRDPIPRVVWCREKGMIHDDEASFLPDVIKKNVASNAKEDLSLVDLINAIAPDADGLEAIYQVISEIRNEGKWDNPHLETYAKIKARRNYGISQLALQLRQELIEEGHQLSDLYSADSSSIGDALRDGKQALKQEQASAIANAEDISLEEAQDLSYEHFLTEEERHQMAKAFLKEELPEAELTSDFILKAVVQDNRKWLNATKLFWFLNNPDLAKFLDQRNWLHHAKQFSEGVIFLPDIRAYSAKIKLLQDISLLELLDLDNPDKTFSNDDEEVQAFKQRCWQNRKRIRRLLGITVSQNLYPIQLLRMLVERIGLSLTGLPQKRINGKQVRLYQVDQEELVTPHRIEVLNALDRKGEAIAQKAEKARAQGCHTPPGIINKIGDGVTDRVKAEEFSETINCQTLGLDERLQMLWSAISEGSERFTQWLKRFITDPEIVQQLT
jgi:hypothetical protein